MSFVVTTTPANFDTDVILNPFIKVEFNVDIDVSTITEFSVILAESDTQTIVPAVPGWVYGTRTLTFQLFDYLKEKTQYTLILVGREDGLKLEDGRAAFPFDNYVIRFETGSTDDPGFVPVDPTLPLAKNIVFDGIQPFLGEEGIYKQVYERTGEPISHIVTTAATVGPSGNVIAIAPGGDVYLPPSGLIEYLSVVSTLPENGAVEVTSENIVITFDDAVTNILDDDIIITGVNFAGLFAVEEPSYTWSLSTDGHILTIVLDNFDTSVIYTVTLKATIGSGGANPSGIPPSGGIPADFSLESDYVFSFTAIISPYCTTVGVIRTSLGSLIGDIEDSEIDFLIYKYSKKVTSHFDVTCTERDEVIRYVTCAVKLELVERRLFEGGPATSKRLADLEIAYGRNYAAMIGDLIEDLKDCVTKNWDILQGQSGFDVRRAVKGLNDPRRPISHLSWRRLKPWGKF